MYQHFTKIRLSKAIDAANQSGFTASRWPHNDYSLSLLHIQTHIGEGCDFIVGLTYISYLQQVNTPLELLLPTIEEVHQTGTTSWYDNLPHNLYIRQSQSLTTHDFLRVHWTGSFRKRGHQASNHDPYQRYAPGRNIGNLGPTKVVDSG